MVAKAHSFSLTAQEITLDPHIAKAFMAVNKRDLMLMRTSIHASVDAALECGRVPDEEVQNVLQVAFRVFGREETNRLADEIRQRVCDRELELLPFMRVTPL